jgi:hypothetical protein
MGEIEATGDIITGGLFGRSVEPRAGEASHHGEGHGLCLNCGTALIGPHCHRCGQAGHVHRTLHSIGHDLLHGVFHFEGKIWRTLPMLVTRPGELTRRYVHGERARFVSPLALFLFSIFLMFASISWTGAGDWMHESPEGEQAVVRIDPKDAQAARTQLDSVRQQIKAAEKDGRSTRALEVQKFALKQQLRAIGQDPEHRGIPSVIRNVGKQLEADGHTKLGHKLQNPELLLYKLQSSMYKYSWALIPISTPFLWLLFAWRRQYKMYDHAIFVIYSLSFMSFLFVAITLLSLVPPLAWLIPFLVVFAPPFHMYRQLKGAYHLRRLSALWRTVALLFFASVSFTIFLSLLVALGLME